MHLNKLFSALSKYSCYVFNQPCYIALNPVKYCYNTRSMQVPRNNKGIVLITFQTPRSNCKGQGAYHKSQTEQTTSSLILRSLIV